MRSWPSNNLLRHPLSAPVLLVVVILAVYYPALLSGIHPIDDPGILDLFSASPPLSRILLPGSGYYYRPMAELSFYLDNMLWGMEPSAMHLENILLHCANGLLVYLLARRVIGRHENDNETLYIMPLLAALLFALHPLNVEAVAWIAGRTDPLLGLFVLSASYFWLNWLEKPRWQDMSATLLLFGAALLTKETALAFGAVIVALALAWPGSATRKQRLSAINMIAAPGVLLVIITLVFWSGTSGLSRFMGGTDLQLAQGAWHALIAYGFYVRKLIVPFPLNFAINEVNPLNGLLGVAILPFLWWVLRLYRLSGVFFVSAALLIMPAILVAVKQVAWTPFAERYLYLSTAFVALGLAGIAEVWQRKYPVVLLSFFILLLSGSALVCFQRNLLWKDPLSFFQDAVEKSPEFGSVYYSLGGILIQKGEIDQALAAFTTADQLNKRVSMRYPIKAGIMGTMLAKGEFLEARTYFFQIFNKKQDASADFLELLQKADGSRLISLGHDEKLLLAHDLLETLDLLNQKKPDPFWLYRSGQFALIMEDTVRAADFFRRSYAAAPVDAHYRPAAHTYLLKLERAK